MKLALNEVVAVPLFVLPDGDTEIAGLVVTGTGRDHIRGFRLRVVRLKLVRRLVKVGPVPLNSNVKAMLAVRVKIVVRKLSEGGLSDCRRPVQKPRNTARYKQATSATRQIPPIHHFL